MEGSPFNLFGDPDEFRARMEELSEQMQSSQRVAWADNAIKLAVEMTVASINQLDLTGSADEQAMQVRDAIRVLFPEAVTLVREAREGLALEQLEAQRDRRRRGRGGRRPARPGSRSAAPGSPGRCWRGRRSAAARAARRRRLAAPERAEGDVVAEGDAVEQRLPGRRQARAAGAQRRDFTTWSRRATRRRTASTVNR